MNPNLPREILGSLIMAPRLLEACDLSADDLPAGRLRRIFEILSTLWEDGHPESISISILADRLGGNEPAAFVSDLLTGLQKPNAEKLTAAIREMRKKAIVARLMMQIERQAKAGALCLDEIRAELAEYDNLESPISNVKPLLSVESKDISWLWQGRIPFGMLSLVAGSPGQGKSTLGSALTAMLSRGVPLPDSGGACLECDSLILAAEDPIAQVVRPRAEINGGDLSKIFIIDFEELGAGEIFGRLRRALMQNPKIKFVVIDPLNAFLKAGTDYFRDPDVRRSLLRPLAILAEESGAAVLGIVHLNKRTDESGALNRIGGSVAYGAAARSVLALGLDPDNEERRLLAPAKCNYSKPPGTIAFTIGEGGKVDFDLNPVDIGADELLQKRDRGQAAEGDFAAEWLIGQLREGPVNLNDLRQAAKKDGISGSSLFRIRKRVGVVARVSGFGRFKASSWELPR